MPNSESKASSETLHVQVDGDLLFVRVIGTISMQDFETIIDLYAQMQRTHGRSFALFDATRMEGIDGAARKAISASSRLTNVLPTATAIFGASFTVRTLGNMIERAVSTLQGRSLTRKFFDTEAQARAYLDQERMRSMSEG